MAFAAASRAGSLGLHGSEHRANRAYSVTRTVTGRTGFWLRTSLAARTVTSRTGHVLANLKLLGASCEGFLQGELSLNAQVSSLILLWLSATASKATAESAESAESPVSAEDVAKHREDVIHVHAGSTTESAAESALRTVESKLVVLLTLLRVVQNLVSLGSFLELFFRLLVARVAVRVILDGYLAVSLLDFVF